jgi:urease accessory protein
MAALPVSSSQGAVIRVTSVIGNVAEPAWRERLGDAQVDVIRLDQAEAQKSRLRKAAQSGAELAITLDRETRLRDGDILFWDQAGRRAVVTHIDLRDVMIIDLGALAGEPPDAAMARCVELGHALGNQHWPAVVRGTRVYVPLTVARDVMQSVMKTHDFARVGYSFAPGAQVIPHLTASEARRLFGTAGGHRHDGPPE